MEPLEPHEAAARTLARLGRLLEHTCPQLSLAQYRVLGIVDEGGERASQLAARLALAKPTVTAVVDGLEARGLLARSGVAGDRRAVRLTLTPEGRAALGAADGALGCCVDRLLDRVEDRGLVLAALADLRGALDRLLAERPAPSEAR